LRRFEKRHQTKLLEIWGEAGCLLHLADARRRSQISLSSFAKATADRYFGIKSKGRTNQKKSFYPKGGGSFQFFPQKILFYKNFLTKPRWAGFHDYFSQGIQQVFQRGGQLLSILSVVRSI